MKRGTRIQCINGPDLGGDLLQEVSDAYRFVFNNVNGHWLVFPSTQEFVAPSEIFGRRQGAFYGLPELDSFPRSRYPRHHRTGEQAILWHDPYTTFEVLGRKLKAPGAYVAITRDQESGRLDGMTFGYQANLHTVFEGEWQNPFMYTQLRDPQYYLDEHVFLKVLRENSGMLNRCEPESEVFCWNAAFTMPWSRGLSVLLPMVQHFFQMVPEESKTLINIQELTEGSAAYQILTGLGVHHIRGFLPKGTVISVAQVKSLAEGFSVMPRAFIKRVRGQFAITSEC